MLKLQLILLCMKSQLFIFYWKIFKVYAWPCAGEGHQFVFHNARISLQFHLYCIYENLHERKHTRTTKQTSKIINVVLALFIRSGGYILKLKNTKTNQNKKLYNR